MICPLLGIDITFRKDIQKSSVNQEGYIADHCIRQINLLAYSVS